VITAFWRDQFGGFQDIGERLLRPLAQSIAAIGDTWVGSHSGQSEGNNCKIAEHVVVKRSLFR